jgi:hypothetical protein
MTVFFMAVNMLPGADKTLARPTSQCIVSDGENIFFMLVMLYT